jgi:hypothetical protein
MYGMNNMKVIVNTIDASITDLFDKKGECFKVLNHLNDEYQLSSISRDYEFSIPKYIFKDMIQEKILLIYDKTKIEDSFELQSKKCFRHVNTYTTISRVHPPTFSITPTVNVNIADIAKRQFDIIQKEQDTLEKKNFKSIIRNLI